MLRNSSYFREFADGAAAEPSHSGTPAAAASKLHPRASKTVAQLNFVDLAGSERSSGVPAADRDKQRRREVVVGGLRLHARF